MRKSDNPPAFPRQGYVVSQDCEPEQWEPGYSGMTLRDYFAAKALQGFCANGATDSENNALAAYKFADAMLEERAK